MKNSKRLMTGSIYMLLALFLSSMMAFAAPRVEFSNGAITVFSANAGKGEVSSEPYITSSTEEVGILLTSSNSQCPIPFSPVMASWHYLKTKIESEADTAAGYGYELIPSTYIIDGHVPFDASKVSLEADRNVVLVREYNPGKYYFKVKTWFINNPQKAHILTLLVEIMREGPKCAYIKGKVTLPANVALDANGNKRKVKISVCNLVLPNALADHVLTSNMFDTLGAFKHIAYTDDNGNYELYVPEGRYKMLYSCEELNIKNYYHYEFNFYKAPEIQAICEQTITLNDINISRYSDPDTLKCAVLKGVIKLDHTWDIATVKFVARPTESNPLYSLYPGFHVKTYPRILDTLMKFYWSMEIPKGEYKLEVFRNDSLLYSQIINTACNTTTEIPFIDATLNEHPMDQREYKLNINAFDASNNKKLAVDVWLLPSKEHSGAIYCRPLKCRLSEDETTINVPIEWLKTFSKIPGKKRDILILVGDKIWGRNQYKAMYYNQVYTSTEAELVRLEETFDNNRVFTFPLVRVDSTPPAVNHQIKGSIKSDTTKVQGLVNLIKKPDYANDKFKFLNAPTDENGNFKFEKLKAGKYILFAVPLEGSYMPGFYKEGDNAVTTWDNATEIVIPEAATESVKANCQIQLQNFDVNNGSGKIAGKVAANSANGKLVACGVISSDDALKGVFMSVFDNVGNAIRYGETDKNGAFSFKDLLPGTYKISASMYGYTSLTQNITIGSDDNDRDFNGANFYLEPAMSNVKDAKELSVYPNPAKAMVSIDFPAEAGNANISIIDALGNVVYSNTIATVDGDNSYKYNTQNMANGLYLITIELNNGKRISTLLTVVK